MGCIFFFFLLSVSQLKMSEIAQEVHMNENPCNKQKFKVSHQHLKIISDMSSPRLFFTNWILEVKF